MSDDFDRDQPDRPGDFKGRGPRGYRRVEQRIYRDVCEMLADDVELDASEIDVSVSGGVVTLAGSVSGRIERERAEELADSVKGVVRIENDLQVRPGWVRSFEDQADPIDAAGEPGVDDRLAVSDVSGSEWGTGAASDNRPGVGLGGLPAEPTRKRHDTEPSDET